MPDSFMTNLRNSRPIALDFDGVICDSMKECMHVAFGAYSGGKPLPAPFVRYFERYRYLVRPAREYWLIVEAYFRGIDPLSQGEFDMLARDCEEQLKAFEPVYFETREALRSADFEGWISLHRLYRQFADGWPRLEASTIPYVVTTRDRDSLGHLLNSFGIDVPARRWWTKERTPSKPEAILEIAAENNLAPSEIPFLDDHPEHLRDVAKTGASTFWASWGFWPSQDEFEQVGDIRELMKRLSIDE